MKAHGLPVSEKKNFAVCLLCSCLLCCIPNINALRLPLSEKRKYGDGFLCSYVPSCDPWGRASFDPRAIVCTNLLEVHKEMLHTKYQSSRLSSFGEKKI